MGTGNAPMITKKARSAVFCVSPVTSNKEPRRGVNVRESDVSGKGQIEVVSRIKTSRLRRQLLSKFAKPLSQMILEHGTVRMRIKSTLSVTSNAKKATE